MKLLYTAPDKALECLRSQRTNPVPANEPETLQNDCIEKFLLDGEYAVLARQFGTPNFETLSFVRKARECGLKPVILEYSTDKFSGENTSKLSCGVIEIEKSPRVNQFIVCEVAAFLGQPISKVNTLWGQQLLDFHHEMMKKIPELADVPIIDMSQWLHEHGKVARKYYFPYLSLFVRHAVLFEIFLDNIEEFTFTRDIVIPAINQATEVHGAKPLIVPLHTEDGREDAEHWSRYPESLEGFVKEKLGRGMVESRDLDDWKDV